MTKKGEKQLSIMVLTILLIVGLLYKFIESLAVFKVTIVILFPLLVLFFTFRVQLDSINEERFQKQLGEFGPLKLKKYLKIQVKMLIVTKMSHTIYGDKEEVRKIQEKIDFLKMKMNQI